MVLDLFSRGAIQGQQVALGCQQHQRAIALFRQRQGGDAEISEQVVLASGFLEGANVNAVDELISSMSLTRNFELQVKLMKTADEQARQGARLISGQG